MIKPPVEAGTPIVITQDVGCIGLLAGDTGIINAFWNGEGWIQATMDVQRIYKVCVLYPDQATILTELSGPRLYDVIWQ